MIYFIFYYFNICFILSNDIVILFLNGVVDKVYEVLIERFKCMNELLNN